MTQPAEQTDFRYFRDADGSRWKMPTDNSRGYYWSNARGGWIDQPTNLSGVLLDVERDGTIETDATGALLGPPRVETADDDHLTPWSVAVQLHIGIIHGIVMARDEEEAFKVALSRSDQWQEGMPTLSKSVMPIKFTLTQKP